MKKLYLTMMLAITIVAFKIDYSLAQNVIRTMKRLPDTGQSHSYTNTFGEDSDYLIYAPFYVDHANGTITDTITGLMWQKTDGGEMTYENAAIYCDTLSLAGYKDWRLPNAHELFSIFNHDKVNPALDTHYFAYTLADYWWSNQKQVNDSSKIWVTNAGGGVGNHPKKETLSAGGSKRFHVRAVRDKNPVDTFSSHFLDNKDGTVTDLLTNLMWQQIPEKQQMVWEDALIYADSLKYAGYSDWRLPNIKELQSINDERFISPSMDQKFFNDVNSHLFWSSTSLPNQQTKAWYLDTQYGITTYQFKTSNLSVLCVRDGALLTGVDQTIDIQNYCTLYPNPSTGMCYIHSALPIQNLQISKMSGELLMRINPDSNSFSFQINTPGIYFASIIIKGKSVNKKLIVLKSS